MVQNTIRIIAIKGKTQDFDSIIIFNFENFSKFIQENFHLIVRAGFVFQLKLLKNEYKSIMLNIIPHSNVKSSSNIIHTLFKIKNILKTN